MIAMLNGPDQSELLSLVEGELSQEEAIAVRKRLGADPGALDRIDKLMQDRMNLQSTPEPLLDVDLVSELEPLLARPMLLENIPEHASQTGSYRAKYQRRIAQKWSRVAIAAGVMMIATAGVIALTFSLLNIDTGLTNNSVAKTDNNNSLDTDINSDSSTDTNNLIASSNGTIHHYDASSGIISSTETRTTLANEKELNLATFNLRSGDTAFEAPFAIELSENQAEALVVRIGEMVTDAKTASLVKNFSREEIENYWNDIVVDSDFSAKNKQKLIADMQSHRLGSPFTLPEKQSIRRVIRRTNKPLGEHMAGDIRFDTPADIQWQYGENNVQMSMTLPAEYLIAFLETLQEQFGSNISLRPLNETSASDSVVVDEWNRWRIWQAAIQSFEEHVPEDSSLIVVIPIFAETIK